jgi:hypothetical protein
MRAPLLAVAMLVAGASSLAAQRVTLTILTTGAAFPNPTVANYVAGYVDNPTPVTFRLRTNNWAGGSATATATVEICAVNANLTNGKALSDLKWRPTDLSKPYASILQGCTGAINPARTVVVQQMGKNVTWSNGSVIFEMVLTWATDTGASYSNPIQFRVSVVTP